MLLILCCSSNDYTLEKIESINPEQKSGHAAGLCLTFCCCFPDNKQRTQESW